MEALEAAEATAGPATPEESEHGDDSGPESGSDDERALPCTDVTHLVSCYPWL